MARPQPACGRGGVAPGCREEARATRRVPSISSRPRKPTSARRARLAVARKGLMPPPRMIANPSAFAAKPIAPVLHIAAISAAPQPASKAVSRKGSKVARRLGATFLVGPDEPGSLPFALAVPKGIRAGRCASIPMSRGWRITRWSAWTAVRAVVVQDPECRCQQDLLLREPCRGAPVRIIFL